MPVVGERSEGRRFSVAESRVGQKVRKASVVKWLYMRLWRPFMGAVRMMSCWERERGSLKRVVLYVRVRGGR
jgi:hypothetical protein